jgi:hypothetical protein
MAIFGFGATYGDDGDVSGDFILRGVACIGYTPREAPSLHTLLRHIKVGDVVYLKGYPVNQGLIIKAVGVVVEDKVKKREDLGWGVSVRWVWTRGDRRLGQIKDKYNVHSFTLYEEYNPEIQKEVLHLLLRGKMGRRSRRS